MTIKFISNERFDKDPYVKEAVYLDVEGDGKYRTLYLKKQARNGGVFWSTASVGVTKDDGTKKWLDGFMTDSSFMKDDIKDFLDNRKWETKSASSSSEMPF